LNNHKKNNANYKNKMFVLIKKKEIKKKEMIFIFFLIDVCLAI